MSAAPTRLPAAQRRDAIVAAALRVFAQGSYGGATTAQIAREAGVSEPILYRHFASKRDLYFACLEEAWSQLRTAFEISRYVRRHMREIHAYVAEKFRRAQDLGGIAPERDPEAEAWIFIAGGFLLSVADRLGGVIDDETLVRIREARHRWLSGG